MTQLPRPCVAFRIDVPNPLLIGRIERYGAWRVAKLRAASLTDDWQLPKR